MHINIYSRGYNMCRHVYVVLSSRCLNVLWVFFITGDLKDCCSYVNRSYCETSVFTVNVICLFFLLLLLYSYIFFMLCNTDYKVSSNPQSYLATFVLMEEKILSYNLQYDAPLEVQLTELLCFKLLASVEIYTLPLCLLH